MTDTIDRTSPAFLAACEAFNSAPQCPELGAEIALAEALAAWEKAREPEWQPIETAPTDGTRVLLRGQWAGEIAGPGRVGTFVGAHTGGHTDHPGFDWDVDGGDCYAAWCKPTHWRPLPTPPETV